MSFSKNAVKITKYAAINSISKPCVWLHLKLNKRNVYEFVWSKYYKIIYLNFPSNTFMKLFKNKLVFGWSLEVVWSWFWMLILRLDE